MIYLKVVKTFIKIIFIIEVIVLRQAWNSIKKLEVYSCVHCDEESLHWNQFEYFFYQNSIL